MDKKTSLLQKRVAQVRQHQDKINPDAFVYGSENFVLPFASQMPVIQDITYWRLKLNNAINQLKIANQEILVFKEEAQFLPYVSLIIMRRDKLFKRSQGQPDFLPKPELKRNTLEWSMYIASSGERRKKTTYRKKIDWDTVDTLLKMEQRTYDEILCHQRANAIMVDLNSRSLIAEQEVKILVQAISALIEMGWDFYKHAPWWAGIREK